MEPGELTPVRATVIDRIRFSPQLPNPLGYARGHMNWLWLFAVGVLAGRAVEPVSATDGASPVRYEFAQVQMGVQFRITFYASDETIANQAAEAAFQRVQQLNSMMSDYDATSELMRLSGTAGQGKPVRISPELWSVLSQSVQLSRQSDGAFDVTVGPLVQLWRRARRTGRLPSQRCLTPRSRRDKSLTY